MDRMDKTDRLDKLDKPDKHDELQAEMKKENISYTALTRLMDNRGKEYGDSGSPEEPDEGREKISQANYDFFGSGELKAAESASDWDELREEEEAREEEAMEDDREGREAGEEEEPGEDDDRGSSDKPEKKGRKKKAGKADKDGGDDEPDKGSRKDRADNLHEGHRARLRKRFRDEGGFENFKDHEILEFLLMYGAPRKDVNPLAHQLLETFGSLKAVLEAKPEVMVKSVKGVGEAQATMIAMAVPLARVWESRAMENPRRITNRTELEAYCKGQVLGSRTEKFFVICVDAQCRLLGQRVISEGSLSEVSAYPRSVMETALNYNAHSVFFCHNHPGGTCAPSTEDIASTLQLQKLLGGVGILVLDHIIVAGVQTYSMAQNGDIDFRTRGRGI